jgi:hypothetical protein
LYIERSQTFDSISHTFDSVHFAMKNRWPNDRDSGFHQFLMVRRKCLAKPRTALPVWLATLPVIMLLLMKKPQTLNLNAEAQISHHSKDTRPLSILVPALKHECTAKCGNIDGFPTIVAVYNLILVTIVLLGASMLPLHLRVPDKEPHIQMAWSSSPSTI